MSEPILPELPGMRWPVKRTPSWATTIRTAKSGREVRSAGFSYPVWRIELAYDVLTPDDYRALIGFFNARRGGWQAFLFRDPEDCQVTAEAFATGDGATLQFQLGRSLGGAWEPVYAADNVIVTVNGQPAAASVDALARVTFAAPPAAGDQLCWSGRYWWRVRFADDKLSFEQFAARLWDLKKLELISVKP